LGHIQRHISWQKREFCNPLIAFGLIVSQRVFVKLYYQRFRLYGYLELVMLYLVFKFMNEISDIIYIYIERERERELVML